MGFFAGEVISLVGLYDSTAPRQAIINHLLIHELKLFALHRLAHIGIAQRHGLALEFEVDPVWRQQWIIEILLQQFAGEKTRFRCRIRRMGVNPRAGGALLKKKSSNVLSSVCMYRLIIPRLGVF